MTQGAIQRLALGTPISLGCLYNACEDKPCNMYMLTKYPPPPTCVNLIEIQNTYSDFVHEKSKSDKFTRLNVAAELKLSLSAGLVNVSGSGEYFNEAKDSERIVSVSLVHKITTVHESMNILDKNLRDVINLDALKHPGATHVVTGVTWGGTLVITIKYENNERGDEDKIVGNLQAQLKKLSINVAEGSGRMNFEEGGKVEKSRFTLKIVGDVHADGPFPTTIEDAMDLLKQLPPRVKASNKGKGVPIRYEMISLKEIKAYFGFNVKIERVPRAIQEKTIHCIVTMFDEVNAVEQKLNDLCADVKKYEDHLPDEWISEVMQLRNKAAVAQFNFKTKLKKLLVQVRSCKAELPVLDELRQKYDCGLYSPRQVLKKLHNDFRAVKAKIELISRLQKLDVILVPSHTEALSSKLLEFKGKQVYVLFGESNEINQNAAEWNKHLHKFSALMDDRKASGTFRFMYVDLDAAKHLQPEAQDGKLRKILLQRFDEHGLCVESDVMSSMNDRAPQWIPAAFGKFPENAVEGGWDGREALYVARAWHDGHLIPGKLQPSKGCCSVSYYCREHVKKEYEVLVAAPHTVQWMKSGNGDKVKNAIEGGHEGGSRERYYIGRCGHSGALIPGKVHLSKKVCYIPYASKEHYYSSYEILVSK